MWRAGPNVEHAQLSLVPRRAPQAPYYKRRPQNLLQNVSHPKRVHSLLWILEESGGCAKPYTMWQLG